jgi:hypothetical protein
MVDKLLRSAPSKARAFAERTQADEVYRAGTSMRVRQPQSRVKMMLKLTI